MAGEALIWRDGPISVPLNYQVPSSGELVPVTVGASIDGSAAAAAFYAVVQVLDPNGRSVGKYRSDQIAAGGSADVTWFPNVGSSSSGGGGSGTGLVQIFSSTLSSAASSIDTGANSIPAGHGDLVCFLTGNCSTAANSVNVNMTFNNNTSNSYWVGWVRNLSGALDGPNNNEQPNIALGALQGSSLSGEISTITFTIPHYDSSGQTKVGSGTYFWFGAAGASRPFAAATTGFGYSNGSDTGPITRIALTAATGNFNAGTRFQIYGTN